MSEYYLKSKVMATDDQDSEYFERGTMIHPIWDSRYLTKHLQEKLEKANSPTHFYGGEVDKPNKVMCVIGRYWVPVERSNIGENT